MSTTDGTGAACNDDGRRLSVNEELMFGRLFLAVLAFAVLASPARADWSRDQQSIRNLFADASSRYRSYAFGNDLGYELANQTVAWKALQKRDWNGALELLQENHTSLESELSQLRTKMLRSRSADPQYPLAIGQVSYLIEENRLLIAFVQKYLGKKTQAAKQFGLVVEHRNTVPTAISREYGTLVQYAKVQLHELGY
jgi:hypothetical protein